MTVPRLPIRPPRKPPKEGRRTWTPNWLRRIEEMPEDSGATIAWGCVFAFAWITFLGFIALLWWAL